MNKNEQNVLANKIRAQYTEKQHTDIDELKELDKKVKRPVNVFAYIFGSISAIIMGSGMSLVMTEIGAALGKIAAMTIGCSIGVLGLVLACIAYPLYNRTIKRERKKIAPEILRLTDELMK